MYKLQCVAFLQPQPNPYALCSYWYMQFQLVFAVVFTEEFSMNTSQTSTADIACCAVAQMTAKSVSIKILHDLLV